MAPGPHGRVPGRDRALVARDERRECTIVAGSRLGEQLIVRRAIGQRSVIGVDESRGLRTIDTEMTGGIPSSRVGRRRLGTHLRLRESIHEQRRALGQRAKHAQIGRLLLRVIVVA